MKTNASSEVFYVFNRLSRCISNLFSDLLDLCFWRHLHSQRQSWRGNRGTVDNSVVKTKQTSAKRLRDLMEMPGSTESGSREVQAGPWGLGDRRTLDQFIKFTGVSVHYLLYEQRTLDVCVCVCVWSIWSVFPSVGTFCWYPY